MPIVRDIKKRDHNKTLILDMGEKHGSKTLKIEEKKKIKKKSEDEFMFITKEDEVVRPGRDLRNYFPFLILSVLVLFIMNMFQVGSKVFGVLNDVEVNAMSGYKSLVEGGKDAVDSNLGGAVQYFESAGYAFERAKDEVYFLGTKYPIGAKNTLGDTAYSLLESGANLSSAASYFTQGVSGLQELPIQFMENNALQLDQIDKSKNSLTEKLKESLQMFNMASEQVNIASKKLKNAPSFILPSELKQRLDQLTGLLDELQKRVPALLNLMGDRYPHRYLILFQNNTESRPTGGFIGSFLIVDVNDGYITKAEFNDVYDYDGQLNEVIPAPLEISALTDNWRMRDSNFSPDFSVSGAKAAWFLEKEGGPGVDTVIAINQSILSDLLSITGPIKVDGLDASLTSTNYNTVLTYIVESKIEGTTTPKKVLDRVIPSLQEKLKDPENFKSVVAVLQKEMQKKNILAWSKDENIQHFFNEIGLSGTIQKIPDDEDFLNITSINIGGNKSDLYLRTEVLHETVIEKTGSVTDIITIARKHTWDPSVILKWNEQLKSFGFSDMPEWIQNILGRGNNRSVVKVYVPKGAVLVDALGVEMKDVYTGYDENTDKGYFYYLDEVAPQNESKVTLTYELPFKLDLGIADEYRLTVQKQPGLINDVKLIKTVFADARITNYRTYPEEIFYDKGDVLSYETSLIGDQYFASLWGIE